MAGNGDQDDLRAQLALEAKLSDWQVHRAHRAVWVHGVEVPAGSYWAEHWRLADPPAVAMTLDELECEVNARTTPGRSIMRELLTGDEIRRFEVGVGRFFLPGPPP
jgi:hypothetical protein